MARQCNRLNDIFSELSIFVPTVLLFSLSMPVLVNCESPCWTRRFRLLQGYTLLQHVVTSKRVPSRVHCEAVCIAQPQCLSYNYEEGITGNLCEVNNATRRKYGRHFVSKPGSSYWEDVEAWRSENDMSRNETDDLPTPQPLNMTLGCSRFLAASSCKQIKTVNKHARSGLYWLSFDRRMTADKAFQAYCDHETDGGGWTLVWSYTFTNYDNFTSPVNAITPRPRWPWGITDVPVSTTVPRSETQYAAMDRELWYNLGPDFLVKSNINHWISCRKKTGSFLHWWWGNVTCRNVKNVTDRCHGTAPDYLNLDNCGPRLTIGRTGSYYFFDSCMKTNFPVHDSCGFHDSSSVYQKKDVDNPHGNLYFR